MANVNDSKRESYGQSAGETGEQVIILEGGGTADVVGPASATDNAIARFDTTTGKLIQNSSVTIDDSGNLAVDGQASRSYSVNRNTTADTAGNTLTIQAGGATSGATNKAGGNLLLNAGISVGNARSDIVFSNCAQGSSGTTSNTVSERMRLLGATNARLVMGVSGTLTDTVDGINFVGTIAQGIYHKRHTTDDTAGSSLTIQAGGATSGATNKNGGLLTLSAGQNTGTGRGDAQIKVFPPGASGTNDVVSVPALSLFTLSSQAVRLVIGEGTSSTDTRVGVTFNGSVGEQNIYVKRITTADTAGNNLTIQAGGATSGATNKAGGTLILSSGVSTGSNRGNVLIKCSGQGAIGTADNTLHNAITIFGASVLGTICSLSGNPSGTGYYGANGFFVHPNATGYFAMPRHNTTNTAGNTLTVQAGGATSGATDKNGGNLIEKSGQSTGTGTSQYIVQTPTPGATGTEDNAYETRMTVDSTGATFEGTVTMPLVKITGGVPGVGKVLTSDADGDATWETPAAGGGFNVGCSATNLSTQTLNTGGTDVKLTLSTENFDIAGNYDPTTNYRFTAPSDGYYEISVYGEISSASTDQFCNLKIYKNGSALKTLQTNFSGAYHRMIFSGRFILNLASGDYIELYGTQQSSGNTATVQAGANLTISKL